MRTKIIIIAGLLVVIGCVIAGFLASRPETFMASVDNGPVFHARTNLPAPAATQEKEIAAATRAPLPTVSTPVAEALVPETPPLMNNGYVVQDPLARIALNFVGEDDEATAYWLGAINDPSLPPEERKDLIEDLNETGLSDPDHPNAQDMPLILRRIQIIAGLRPYVIDPVNIDALAEADKDLHDLADGVGPK